MVFNAITKQSVLEAMQHPRDVDGPLVILWPGGRWTSGGLYPVPCCGNLLALRRPGAVGGAAHHLRPRTRNRSKRHTWTIDGTFTTPQGQEFSASLQAGQKIGKLDIKDETSARAIEQTLKNARVSVDNVESKPAKRHPYAPFPTPRLAQAGLLFGQNDAGGPAVLRRRGH